MKKRLLKYIGKILCFVLVVGLFIGSVSWFIQRNTVFECLVGEVDKVGFVSEGFQDYTKFKKYTFEDSEKLRKELENHKYLKRVKADDIEYLTGIFEDFEGWIDNYEICSEYDIDANDIDEEDYFYVEDSDIEAKDDGRIVYYSYDLYYFDTQSMQGYFLHNNI